MNSYEEDLQRKLEAGQEPDGDALDVAAYREVFRSLTKEPGFKLSQDFAKVVATKAASRQRRRNTSDYFWFVTGILILLTTSVATLILTGFRLDFGFLNVMSDYKGLAVFGVIFISFLHWLDRRIVRGKQILQ